MSEILSYSNNTTKNGEEDWIGHAPYSDDDIAHILSREGIEVARRTVAKYRSKMNIPLARERKRNYQFEVGS